MARYMHKYVGTYRVKAEVTSDNDFPRVEGGSIDPSFDDEYIDCKNGCRIYHWGKDILQAYIPTIQRGRNVIKDLKDIVIDVVDNDSEILFVFKAKDIEVVAERLGAKTIGCNISPFSTKNLRKGDYKLPEEDMARYKETISEMVPFEVLAVLNDFKSKKMTKNERENFKKSGLQIMPYIHSIGKFEALLKDLTKFKEEI